jgi:hypothetical protein
MRWFNNNIKLVYFGDFSFKLSGLG